mmetsp:Transcript_32987/g.50476  ORF Transcript_32987/g.50476 Transcript_32987/m.50476 type:complete len:117 (+) Transcript_32987:528-878(+)
MKGKTTAFFSLFPQQSNRQSQLEEEYSSDIRLQLALLKKRKNYASKEIGASIIDATGVANAGNILSKSKDTYLILSTCDASTPSSLVIHLSEDMMADTIHVSNSEDFSAQLNEISF